MKKLLLVFLLSVTIGFYIHSEDVTLNNLTVESLKQELAQTSELKEHYKKMAVYSEREAELSVIETNNALTSAFNERKYSKQMEDSVRRMEEVIDNMRWVNIKNEKIISEKDHINENNTIFYESRIATAENSLFESMQREQVAQTRIETLENNMNNNTDKFFILILAIVICFILYAVQSFLLKSTPKTKKTKPLTIVPKKEDPKEVKETTDPVVDNPKPIKPSTKMTYFERLRRDKEIKAKIKLQAEKAKVLTLKEGDIIEEMTIQEVNKGMILGPLGGWICATLGIKKPEVKPEPKPEPEPEVKTEPKTKPPKKNETKKERKNRLAREARARNKEKASKPKTKTGEAEKNEVENKPNAEPKNKK